MKLQAKRHCDHKIWWYSKALRSTLFGERENSCSSKFVQLLLLNRVKAKWSENRAAQGFHFINSFISNFFGPNSKTCTCKVRAARGRVSRGLTVQRDLSAFNRVSGRFWTSFPADFLKKTTLWDARFFKFWFLGVGALKVLKNWLLPLIKC